MNDYPKSKAAIRGQGQIVAKILRELTLEQWHQPANLPGWGVLTLVAHLRRATLTILMYGVEPLNVPPQYNRINYYNFNGPDLAASVTQRAQEVAAQSSPEAMPGHFTETLEQALALLDKLGPETVINSAFGPITIEEYLPTRIIELTVHSLDLALSLDQPPLYDPQALAITIEILDTLLGQPRPAALANDDAAFVAAATGRIPYPGLKIPAFS